MLQLIKRCPGYAEGYKSYCQEFYDHNVVFFRPVNPEYLDDGWFNRTKNWYDLKEKGLSKGEFNSVKQAVGGIEKLIDENAKDKHALALVKYIADEDKEEKILENQQILVQPIVRNGKKATVGYQPEVWKEWD